jgi:hypothetical protein
MRSRRTSAFLTGLVIAFFIMGALMAVRWLADRADDRRHTIVVNAPTPIFAGSGEEGRCNGALLTTAWRGNQFKVERIRYLKDCATIDIVLGDGRKGYFVLGQGDLSINPPIFQRAAR